MIVPGCDGLRGAVTLGYLALVYGYIHRVSVRGLVMLTTGGVLLGYLLNLVRLCVLVCYYRLGVAIPSIQTYGVQVDYVIGVSLFVGATIALGLVVGLYLPPRRHCRQHPVQVGHHLGPDDLPPARLPDP